MRFGAKAAWASALMAVTVTVFSVGAVLADDDNNKRNNSGEGVSDTCDGDNNCVDKPSGSSDTYKLSGEVLAINTLTEPHEIILGTTDGRVTVKIYGKDSQHLVRSSGVKVRHYIEVRGYKEHENLFWADTISNEDDD